MIPRIAKALDYLLKRQQMFGGWSDPLQSYENFRTPFRETQMAVLALSEFYKGPEFGKDGALRGDGQNGLAERLSTPAAATVAVRTGIADQRT